MSLEERELSADLLVVGGGLAGVCCAVAAARCGAKVVLMQERPVLGGNASSEIRMWPCGARGENNRTTGILEEISLENLYRNPTKNFYLWDMVLLETVRKEKNITLLLNCTALDAETDEGAFPYGRERKIKSVTGYQMTTQTKWKIRAGFYADCSGDSVLAPLSGARFYSGREAASDFGECSSAKEADAYTMGNTVLLQARETAEPVPFRGFDSAKKLKKEDFENREIDLRSDSENFWYLELGGTKNTIRDAEEISEEALSLALGTWDHIKNSGEYQAENFELEFLSFLPGKRESRRMAGEMLLTANDILSGKTYEDTVSFGGWPLDDHFPEGFYHKGVPNTDFKTPSPYPIPYRVLYSENVDNLFFAGRNISVTHLALSSTRVMSTCASLGQAAGTAAALAVKYRLSPHGVYLQKIEELQDLLLENDSFLPAYRRKVSPFCRGVPDAVFDGTDRPNSSYGTVECGAVFENRKAIEYRFDSPLFIQSCHITFDSDLDRKTLPGRPVERFYDTKCNVLLSTPQTCMPKTLAKDFCLEALTENGALTLLSVKENRRRFYCVPIEKKLLSLRLTIFSNWGESGETRVFSFDFR